MPDDRIDAFLAAAGWAEAERRSLAGDASARRYERLTHPDDTKAVLMIAPPAPDDSTQRFAAIGTHLLDQGFSAPRTLHGAPEGGLLLLEDLGDAVFAREIERKDGMELPLYEAAIDLLAALQAQPAPANLPVLDAAELAAMTAPAADWYAGQGTPHPALAAALEAAILPALRALPGWDRPVLALRDFHAENLIWLPERAGVAKVGLLDYQDAFAGLPAYDLVSLLEDARRDLAPGIRDRVEARFASATGTAPDDLALALAVLGAQRNLRILGVFARLCLHFGKARYVDLIPRVWDHVQRDLAHPALSELREVATALPAPTPDFLNELRSKCGSHPTP